MFCQLHGQSQSETGRATEDRQRVRKGLTLHLRAGEVSCYAGHRSRDTGGIILEYIVYLSSPQTWNNLDFVFLQHCHSPCHEEVVVYQ